MAEDFNIGLYYKITRLDTGNSVLALRGDTPPQLVSVGARWTVVDRPRRKGFVTWAGNDPARMDVPVLFDGWDKLESVEDEIRALYEMRVSSGEYKPPPQVRIEGAVPAKRDKWVIETDLDFGDNVIWHEAGYRVRQDVVIHLLEYVEPEELAIKPASTSHLHNVKAGETLKTISRDEYGTPKYWSAIKKANNIRDAKKLPKILRIPPIVNP